MRKTKNLKIYRSKFFIRKKWNTGLVQILGGSIESKHKTNVDEYLEYNGKTRLSCTWGE
jgi:hypothetical protein